MEAGRAGRGQRARLRELPRAPARPRPPTVRHPAHPGPEAAGIDPADRPALESVTASASCSRLPLDGFEARAWTGCFGGLDTPTAAPPTALAMKGFRVATMDLDGVRSTCTRSTARPAAPRRTRRLQADDFAELAAFIADAQRGPRRHRSAATPTSTPTGPPGHGDGADIEIWDSSSPRPGSPTPAPPSAATSPGASTRSPSAAADGSSCPPRASTSRRTVHRPAGGDLSDHPPLVAVRLGRSGRLSGRHAGRGGTRCAAV